MWRDTLLQHASEVGFDALVEDQTDDLPEQSVQALHGTVEIPHGSEYPVVRIQPDNKMQFLSNALLEFAEVEDIANLPHLLRTQYTGRDITEWILPSECERFERAKVVAKKRRLRARATQGRKYRRGVAIEFTFVSCRGTQTPVRASITCAIAFDTYQISLVDVTDLKESEAELRRARDEVEKRVEERTAELAEANERLETEIAERRRVSLERGKPIAQLQEALAEVKALEGSIPICAWCKKVRDDTGFWRQVEDYVSVHVTVGGLGSGRSVGPC